jgi:hypothetical protein
MLTLEYMIQTDLAQSTSYQNLQNNVGGDNDQCKSGYLHLFEPSSTTFVKHFIYTNNCMQNSDLLLNTLYCWIWKYYLAINAVDFKMFRKHR